MGIVKDAQILRLGRITCPNLTCVNRELSLAKAPSRDQLSFCETASAVNAHNLGQSLRTIFDRVDQMVALSGKLAFGRHVD